MLMISVPAATVEDRPPCTIPPQIDAVCELYHGNPYDYFFCTDRKQRTYKFYIGLGAV